MPTHGSATGREPTSEGKGGGQLDLHKETIQDLDAKDEAADAVKGQEARLPLPVYRTDACSG